MAVERTGYRELVDRTRVTDAPTQTSEGELDQLVHILGERKSKDSEADRNDEVDRIQRVRHQFAAEFIPLFNQIRRKYHQVGVKMHMNAEQFVNGGREISIRFDMGEFGAVLEGIVTNEAIAFQETRHAPNLGGELVSGPRLRLRNLTAAVFREFICERLTVLVRTALRHH